MLTHSIQLEKKNLGCLCMGWDTRNQLNAVLWNGGLVLQNYEKFLKLTKLFAPSNILHTKPKNRWSHSWSWNFDRKEGYLSPYIIKCGLLLNGGFKFKKLPGKLWQFTNFIPTFMTQFILNSSQLFPKKKKKTTRNLMPCIRSRFESYVDETKLYLPI